MFTEIYADNRRYTIDSTQFDLKDNYIIDDIRDTLEFDTNIHATTYGFVQRVDNMYIQGKRIRVRYVDYM